MKTGKRITVAIQWVLLIAFVMVIPATLPPATLVALNVLFVLFGLANYAEGLFTK